MAGRGRPTKYRTEYCQKVLDYMGEGGSKEALAGVLGVAKATIYNWAEDHPAFGEAIEKGEQLSLLWWLDQGRRLMLEGNASVWVFNMKNRFGWKDKQELSGDKHAPVTVEIVRFGGTDA